MSVKGKKNDTKSVEKVKKKSTCYTYNWFYQIKLPLREGVKKKKKNRSKKSGGQIAFHLFIYVLFI